MASILSSLVQKLLLEIFLLISFVLATIKAGNFYTDFDISWGNGRAQIHNNGELLTLSLDKISGSGIQSKNEYLFGKIDMQIKLVRGNSAGIVTTYYVCKPRSFISLNICQIFCTMINISI